MNQQDKAPEGTTERAIQEFADDLMWRDAWAAMLMDIREIQTVKLNELPQHFRRALLALGEM